MKNMNKRIQESLNEIESGLSFEEFKYEFNNSFSCANMYEFEKLDYVKMYGEYLKNKFEAGKGSLMVVR
ncbi:hypothetical protein SAMN04487895_101701 [Paenibacillus sophorae]|uniref:Uncharacterized protein n=1 Tax=Paenibacillus sophorae TaxID=1333845 RepID=A0A1H8H073_9BACL|nr:hypothetical protein [Paenibacillus sophorae]QWU14392.1 hypothetical protein KP014_21020 [Paenibacillus sophorae]SEN49374.1 hypothetical protein SAMN04487895_101701 [Paenibacillus sophorae]